MLLKKSGGIYKIIPLLFFISALTGCAPTLYVPNPVITPLVDEPKTFSGSLYLGTGGFGGQASYSVDSHVVVLADGCTNNFNSRGINQTFSYDGAAGFYGAIAYNLDIQVMAGLGYGRGDDDVSYNMPFGEETAKERDILHASYSRIFLQAALVKTGKKGDKMGYAIRLVNFNPGNFYYRKILSVNKPDPNAGTNNLILEDSVLRFQSGRWLLEPCVNFNIKTGRHGYFSSSIGFSIPLFYQDPNADFQPVLWPLIFTGGYTFVF